MKKDPLELVFDANRVTVLPAGRTQLASGWNVLAKKTLSALDWKHVSKANAQEDFLAALPTKSVLEGDFVTKIIAPFASTRSHVQQEPNASI